MSDSIQVQAQGYCPVGALAEASEVKSNEFFSAIERLAAQIRERADWDAEPQKVVADWNDDPQRTREEVIRMMYHAANVETEASTPAHPPREAMEVKTMTADDVRCYRCGAVAAAAGTGCVCAQPTELVWSDQSGSGIHYLIRQSGERVDLYQAREGRWECIRRNVSRGAASCFGFSLNNPAVQALFQSN